MARLENISATSLNYDVTNGNLLAVDVITRSLSEFSSVNADMIVTTRQRTSVSFWQKANNLVCLTAAQTSLYVDDSCRRICQFTSQDTTRRFSSSSTRQDKSFGAGRGLSISLDGNGSDRNDTLSISEKKYFLEEGKSPSRFGLLPLGGDLAFPGSDVLEIRAQYDKYNRRQIGTAYDTFTQASWNCTGDPRVDDFWDCSVYDPIASREESRCPPGSKNEFRYQVHVCVCLLCAFLHVSLCVYECVFMSVSSGATSKTSCLTKRKGPVLCMERPAPQVGNSNGEDHFDVRLRQD